MRRTFVWQLYSLEKTVFLSQFEAARGNTAAAIGYAREVLERRGKLYGEHSGQAAIARNDLANALAAANLHAESADRISRMPNWQLVELSRLVLRLRQYATPFEGEAGDPESTRFRFFEAVTATLNELPGSGRLLLVVDDLHFADQPTLLLLRHVLRNIDHSRLGIAGM